jgi:predicted RNA-binding Zn ribbon-like protein
MSVAHADLQRVTTVREGLRALVLGHGGAPPDIALVQALDDVARTIPLQVSFGVVGGLQPAARRPVDIALGWLLIVVEDALADGRWTRLKGCREPSCQWVFYDSSKNRSGRWCSMSMCGTTNKQRALVARRRATQATGATSSRRPTARSPVTPARAARPPSTTT